MLLSVLVFVTNLSLSLLFYIFANFIRLKTNAHQWVYSSVPDPNIRWNLHIFFWRIRIRPTGLHYLHFNVCWAWNYERQVKDAAILTSSYKGQKKKASGWLPTVSNFARCGYGIRAVSFESDQGLAYRGVCQINKGQNLIGEANFNPKTAKIIWSH